MYKVFLLALLSPALAFGQAVQLMTSLSCSSMMLMLLSLSSMLYLQAYDPVEQDYVETKSFTSRWVELPAPTAMTHPGRLGGDVAEIGTYKFAMAFVDCYGKLSPLSDAVTLTPTYRAWQLKYKLPEYPVWTQISGTVLFSWREGPFIDPAPPAGHLEYQVRPAGVQHNASIPGNATRAIVPIGCFNQHTFRDMHLLHKLVRWYPGGAQPEYSDNNAWPKSTILTEKPILPPILQLQQFPNKRCLVALAAVGNQGESPLSPPLVIEQSIFGRNTHQENVPYDGFSSGISFRYHGKRAPGTLGYHVYVKYEEANGSRGKWIRQPAPHARVPFDKPNDYLWPMTITQYQLFNYHNSGLEPMTGQRGKSLISPLQQALDIGVKHVLVTETQTISSPIIHDLYNGHGTTIDRWIQAPHGLPWKINTNDLAGGPNEWPIWVESALKTNIVNCTMSSSHCSTGIDFGTFYDSSNFSFRSRSLSIALTKLDTYTVGMIQRQESVSGNGHTSSEVENERMGVYAANCIVVEGNQSVNWVNTGETQLTSHGGINSALITANNWMNYNMRGSWITAGSSQDTQMALEAALFNWEYDIWQDPDAFRGGRAMLNIINTQEFSCENIFVDRGFPAWMVCGAYGAKRITFGINNTNQWANNLNVIEYANGGKVGGATILKVLGTNSRHGNPFVPIVASGRPGGIEVTKDNDLGILRNMIYAEYHLAQ